MTQKSINYSKVAAVLGGLILVGGAASYMVPNEVVTFVPGDNVTEYVNVTQEVEVDNGNLRMVLDHIYDNDGDVNYLLDDLDDDEVEQIADRIVFVNEIKKFASDYVDAEVADYMDRMYFEDLDVEFDDRDIERIKVKGDAEDIVIADIDFEDKDADLEVTVEFEQDDIDYVAVFEVEVKDGEVDDMSLISLDLD